MGYYKYPFRVPCFFYVFLKDIFYFVLKSTKANNDKFQALCIGKKTYDNIETFRH